MDLFGDKQYDQLDWLTKTVEPITWSTLDKLNALPDSFDISIEDIKRVMVRYGTTSLYLPALLSDAYAAHDPTINFKSQNEHDFIDSHYSIKLIDEPKVNFLTNTIEDGEIKIVKTKRELTEEEIKSHLGNEGESYLYNNLNIEVDTMPRMNEILDLMECPAGIKKKIPAAKRNVLVSRYREIMSNLEWNIRDVDLSNKVAVWITQYVNDGNLAAFTNFCRLKAITHRNYPIYKLEDEQ